MQTTTAHAATKAATSNVVQFKPRASNAAFAWLATTGVSPRAQQVGRAIARHARVHLYGKSWRHIRAGELACWPSIETLRKQIGCNHSTVERGLKELEQAGLVKRRTMHTNSYVFPEPIPAHKAPPADLPADLPADPIEPQRELQREPREEAARARRLIELHKCLYVELRQTPYVAPPTSETNDRRAAVQLCEAWSDEDLTTLLRGYLRLRADVSPGLMGDMKPRTLGRLVAMAPELARKLEIGRRAT